MKNLKELQQIFNCNKVNHRTLQLAKNNYNITIIVDNEWYYIIIEKQKNIVFADLAETIEEVYCLIEATEYNCMNELIDNEFNSLTN